MTRISAQKVGTVPEPEAECVGSTSSAIIRQDHKAPGTLHIICFECFEQFDVAGEFEHDEPAVVDRVVDHFRACSPRRADGEASETIVYTSAQAAVPLWKLTTEWTQGRAYA